MQRYRRAKCRNCGSQLRASPANSCTNTIGVPLPASSQCSLTPSSVLIVGIWHSMWMKAVVCKQFGPPDSLSLEDLPSPRAGRGEVVISVKAASVNFPDVLIIQNKYQVKPPLPFTPGSELSGIVKEVGPGVTRVRAGERVMALTS